MSAPPTVPDRGHAPAGFLPRTTYLGVAASLSGAAAAWLAAQLLTDLGPLVDSYRILDLLVLTLLGAGVGGFLLGFAALRQGRRVWPEVALGVVIGGLAAAAGGAIGLTLARIPGLNGSRAGFLVARVAMWGLVGGLLGWGLGSRFARLDKGRAFDGLLFGFLGGAVAALVYSLPGPTSIWQLLAFLLLGSAVGFGVSRMDRALGILWRSSGASQPANLVRHREWEIHDDQVVPIETAFVLEVAGGRLTARPAPDRPGSLEVAGQVVETAREHRDDEVIVAGGRSYRFHRFSRAAR